MKKLSAMSAIELQTEIDCASGTGFREALVEVDRLRTLCQDIIEIIGTETDSCLDKINVIAHRYFIP